MWLQSWNKGIVLPLTLMRAEQWLMPGILKESEEELERLLRAGIKSNKSPIPLRNWTANMDRGWELKCKHVVSHNIEWKTYSMIANEYRKRKGSLEKLEDLFHECYQNWRMRWIVQLNRCIQNSCFLTFLCLFLAQYAAPACNPSIWATRRPTWSHKGSLFPFNFTCVLVHESCSLFQRMEV